MQNKLQCRRNLQATTPGSAWWTFFLKFTTPDRSFTGVLCNSDQQHPQQPSQQKQQQSSGKNMHQDTSQISGQSVQAKNVNVNATDDVFLAFTMEQQIMMELSGAATEKEKVSVITEAVLGLLKNNASNSSYTSENDSIQC
jgi:hypothetical protein